MANNRKKKRVSDLEYNVFNSGEQEKEDAQMAENHSGCLTLFGGIIVTIIVCFVIMCVIQMGRNAPAITCASPGCSNSPRSGSNYCWIHSSKNTTVHKSSGSSGSGSSSSSNSSSGSGSIVDRGSSSNTTTKKSRIFSGIENKDNSSSSNSSSD